MLDNPYQFPSTTLTRTETGSRDYAARFYGEATKLLYELKNLMTFRKLGQLKMTRLFTDGTVITAWSVFGQDFVNIDVSQVIPVGITIDLEQQCTVTLINLPDIIPPMRNPHEILEDEIEGTDFIKTYYTFDITKCKVCENEDETVQWEFLFKFDTPITEYKKDPLDTSDHCIISADGGCFAELIDKGSDDNGTYIRWKAYTEGLTQDRTGYGFVKIRAVIYNIETGDIVCFTEQVVKVDCCKKAGDSRPVEIWWEDSGTCQPYIPYSGVTYDAICKMPSQVSIFGTGGLNWYGNTSPYQPLYSIPEIKESCLPMEWVLQDPITFRGNSKSNDNTIFFQLNDATCYDEVRITLKDRCGTFYTVRGIACCDDAASLSIGYTSLLMSCNQQQTLTGVGGCSPYTWAVTAGGGSITQDGVYTAPATNVNCVDNPTIQITDCCGSTASIQLAINCYGSTGLALQRSTATYASCNAYDHPGCSGSCFIGQKCILTRRFQNSKYNCDGTIYDYCDTGGNNYDCWTTCDATICDPPGTGNGCWSASCGGHVPGPACCGQLYDERSIAMKEAGCCPLNPLTGLPYS